MPRNPLLDNVKGILIFLVVLTHFLLPYVVEGAAGTTVDALFYGVFCFHMPFFVFLSGYFSKDAQKARDTAFARSLAPFLFFNTTMMLVFYLGGVHKFSLMTPVYVNWYLLALFAWRVLLADLVKIRFILPLSLAAALLIGFLPEVTNYLALTRIVAFLPFFLLGYYTSPKALEAVRRVNVLVGLLGLALGAAVVYRLTQNHAFSLPLLLADPYANAGQFFMRDVIFALAALFSVSVFILTPAKRIPVLTTWGENSLLIYILHRYVTIAIHSFVPTSQWHDWYTLPVFACAAITTWGLGRPAWMDLYNKAVQWVGNHCSIRPAEPAPTTHGVPRLRRAVGLIALLAVVIIGLPSVMSLGLPSAGSLQESHDDPLHPVLGGSLLKKINADSSVTISFVGDLILLEDQVKQALDPRTMRYDFSPVFEHVKDRLRAADYTIGVLEVPLAGRKAGYSTSNYDDGIPVRLNGPDAWAAAIKDAGIDLVTTANNHVFDRGAAGARRTLDVLDRVGLAHLGSYRSVEERRKNRVFLTEVKGVRLAVLAYTYAPNHHGAAEADQFVGVLAPPKNKAAFNAGRRMVADDVREARRHRPDLIIALPHMGTQFLHEPDDFSRAWAHAMIAEGVDVVLGCHAHATQPIKHLRVSGLNGKLHEGFVVYCPGNFVNCYTKHDGDAAAIVTLHVTKSSRGASVTAASIVPMWIQRRGDGQYAPVPVVDTLRQPKLRAIFSTLDQERIAKVHEIVTQSMLGRRLTLDQMQDRYFYVPPTGYLRQPLEVRRLKKAASERPLKSLDADRAELQRVLRESRKVLLVGDSISEGTKNGGYSWIEPVEPLFPGVKFLNASRGGRTTGELIGELPGFPNHDADAVFLALGVNDVRYRDPRTCAMTAVDYAANINRIVERLRQKNARARFIMISLWPAFDNDVHSRLSDKARDAMIDEYNAVLRQYCRENGHLFIDATGPIRDFLRYRVTDDYLLDHIHPNAARGVRLYGNAVLFGEPVAWEIAME
ncbi:MAG TPA: CapA family protein [Thermoguttaceae bacterium]|nr:CapA family protein [Thermoguttaceae bacterium]